MGASPAATASRHRAPRPPARLARLRRLAPVAAALPLAGCAGVLDPRGPVGSAENIILYDALAVMLAIVVPTLIALGLFAWWFRASNTRAVHRPDFTYSGRIELVTWSIPILVILFLGGIIWIGSHDLDPGKPLAGGGKPIEVEVVALDWKWLFIYPDQGVASVNALTVPAGVPVHFSLTSASVMNAFFVPQLGSMIAVMNGMVTQLNLRADRAGDYLGRSTQYSGDGFSDMQFVLHAVPADAFAGWVAAAHGTGPTLDAAAYRALEQQSQQVAPYTYRAVAPQLFHAIATLQLPPGPGPGGGRGGAGVQPRTQGD